MSKLPTVTISGDLLSDLFFNHEHLAYDTLYAIAKGRDNTSPTADEVAAAIREDARQFVSNYLVGDVLSEYRAETIDRIGEALAADFIRRV